MAKVLKICWGPWENASRDKRELSVYRELGHEVLVLAEGGPEDKGRPDEVESFPVRRYSSKPLGLSAPKRANQLLSLFTWARYASTLKPDIISGHDYIGWTIGWMSTAFRFRKPKFIYDSHEFELGRNVSRNRLRHMIIRKLEHRILNRSEFSIMVNDTIADEVQRIYKLKKRPVVVRSTPEYWEIDEKICAATRDGFDKTFESRGTDVSCVVMYHGGFMKGRGIELLMEAVASLDKVGLVLVGYGPQDYIDALSDKAQCLGIDDRVMFHPAVPVAELWKYVGAADISIAPIEAVVKSYYYSLPNKFFESIQSMTPIITSDFPEMRKLIDEYEIGLTFKPGDPEDLARAISRMRDDKEFYAKCKKNLVTAKKELCWENEKHVLIDAFNKLGLR